MRACRWLLPLLLLLPGCRAIQDDPLPRWESRASQATLQALGTPGHTVCISGFVLPGSDDHATLVRTRPPTYPAVDLVGMSAAEAAALHGQQVEVCGVTEGLVSWSAGLDYQPRPRLRLRPAPTFIGPPLLAPQRPPGYDQGSTHRGPGVQSPGRDRNAPYSRPRE